MRIDIVGAAIIGVFLFAASPGVSLAKDGDHETPVSDRCHKELRRDGTYRCCKSPNGGAKRCHKMKSKLGRPPAIQ